MFTPTESLFCSKVWDNMGQFSLANFPPLNVETEPYVKACLKLAQAALLGIGNPTLLEILSFPLVSTNSKGVRTQRRLSS